MNRKPIDWASLSEAEWLKRAQQQIWLSAFAANNPRAPAHREADRAYDDAKARDAIWMYQAAWNAAYRQAGYQPSEDSINAAKRPD